MLEIADSSFGQELGYDLLGGFPRHNLKPGAILLLDRPANLGVTEGKLVNDRLNVAQLGIERGQTFAPSSPIAKEIVHIDRRSGGDRYFLLVNDFA